MRHNRQSYPLSLLFMLIAACSALMALLTPVARSIASGHVLASEAAASSISGGLITMLLGMVIGSYHYRKVRGLLWGGITGAFLGVLLGPLSLSPIDSGATLLWLTLAGSVLLPTVSIVFRYSNQLWRTTDNNPND